MFTMTGNRRRGGGLTRRETLRAGASSLLGGLFCAPLLKAREKPGEASVPARARRVVMLYLQGGAPTQDMFDMKLDASAEVRSEFQPVASSAHGLDVCELLPMTARVMHRACVVRSVYHNGPCHNNQPMYTGRDEYLRDEEARSSDPPSMGSVISRLDEQAGRTPAVPPYIFLPCALGWGEQRVKGGPHGGFLGHRYDAFSTLMWRNLPTKSGIPSRYWVSRFWMSWICATE